MDFPSDSNLPTLVVACNTEQMREYFQTLLRPDTKEAFEITDCRLILLRYRRGFRCILHYELDVLEISTGLLFTKWVAGTLYANQTKNRSRRKALNAASDIRESDVTGRKCFESVGLIPEVGMILQVFPYDRKLPGLQVLKSRFIPDLEKQWINDLGSGNWFVEERSIEPKRWRLGLSAVLKYNISAREVVSEKRTQKHFYLKVFPRDQSQSSFQLLSELWKLRAEGKLPFAIAKPVAYADDIGAIAIEEAPGVTLQDLLAGKDDFHQEAIQLAQALAAFHQTDFPMPRRHLLHDEYQRMERVSMRLEAVCPDLGKDIREILDGVVQNLSDGPLGPAHLDLKTDHIFFHDNCVGLIDFDSCATSDPMLDLALLLARFSKASDLFGISTNRPRIFVHTFLRQYFSNTPSIWSQRLPFYYAWGLLKVATFFFNHLKPEWRNEITNLIGEARESLSGKTWFSADC